MIPQSDQNDGAPPQATNLVNQDSEAPQERSVVAVPPLERPLKRTNSGHLISPLIIDDALLTDFYLHNLPDFSGQGLIRTEAGSRPEYRSIASRSQLNHATQILIAETARTIYAGHTATSRPLLSESRLVVIKSRLLSKMSQEVARFQNANVVDLVAASLGLALIDVIHGTGQEAIIHFQGIKRVTDSMGGREALSVGRPGYLIRELIYYVGNMASFYHGNPELFAEERHFWPNDCRASNRFRLASIPKHSQLSAQQKRNHHLMLLAGTEQIVLREFKKTNVLVTQFLVSKHLSPIYARTLAKQIESSLLVVVEPPDVWNMPSTLYSERDRALQKSLVRVGSRVGLVVIARLLLLTSDSTVAEMHLDHAVQALLLQAPWRLAEDRGPTDMALWASAIAIAHDQGVIRQTFVPKLATMAQGLDLTSWEEFQAFMVDTFYPSALLDCVVKPLWDEMAVTISEDHTASTESEDDEAASSDDDEDETANSNEPDGSNQDDTDDEQDDDD